MNNLKISIGSRAILFDITCNLIMNRFTQSSASECGVWSALLSDLLLAYETVDKKARPVNIDKRLRCARVFDRALQDAVLHPINIKEFLTDFKDILPKSKTVAVVNAEVDMQLRPKLEALWDKLKDLDTRSIFALPVTDEVAPNYSTLIKHPMDLSLIKAKIERGGAQGYGSAEDFNVDVELMVANCIKYNFKTSELGKVAQEFLRKWKLEYEKGRGSMQTKSKVTNTEDMSILKPQSISECEGKCIILILAQPEVSTLLSHTMASMLETCIRDKKLPSDTPFMASLVQLSQISYYAHDMFNQHMNLAVPLLDIAVLRRSLPVLARYLGEASLQASLTGRDVSIDKSSKDQEMWASFLSSPISRKLFLVICGSSLVKASQIDRGERAHNMLTVLVHHAGDWLAHDSNFFNGVITVCDKPRSVFRKKEIRSRLLKLLVSLVNKGGVRSIAHEVLIRIINLWANTKHPELLPPTTVSASAITKIDTSKEGETFWILKDEVEKLLSTIEPHSLPSESDSASSEMPEMPPNKRVCIDPSLTSVLTNEYLKLRDTFKGVEVPDYLSPN